MRNEISSYGAKKKTKYFLLRLEKGVDKILECDTLEQTSGCMFNYNKN